MHEELHKDTQFEQNAVTFLGIDEALMAKDIRYDDIKIQVAYCCSSYLVYLNPQTNMGINYDCRTRQS